MISHAPTGARLLVLAHFFMAPLVWGQPSTNEGAQVEGVDLRGMATATRRVDKTYPISENPAVSIANKYGAIKVTTWSNPLVRVIAHIRVGAESSQAAERFAQAIEVAGNHIGDKVEVRTVYPAGEVPGDVGYTVDLDVKVPVKSNVTLDNVFGDCRVQDIQGSVSIDSRYGVVELSNLSGDVRVRAKGAFPLTARKLAQGGTFTLRSTQSSFSDIAGVLEVNNYLGSVQLKGLGEILDADITCESGPIDIFLPIDADPRLEASTRFGDIQSDFVWAGETWGDVTRMESTSENSTQRVSLHSSFDTISIHRDSPKPAVEPLIDTVSEPVKQVLTSAIPVTPGADLLVDAMVGNVEIIGIDDPSQVIVRATKFVRVGNKDEAKMALEGMALRLDNENDTVRVHSIVQDDMDALGCTEYRVDLQIQFPRTMLLRIVAQDGDTVVRNAAGGLILEQARGTVLLDGNDNKVDITNRDGNVTIQAATGPVKAMVNGGVLRIERPAADIIATCENGKTIVDTPQAGVKVTNTSGDVRIIALEGVNGDFEVVATDGNISVAIPETADASLFLNANGGTVYSSIVINGTIEKYNQSFQGRMNEGSHRIILETQQGNIVLD